MVKKKKAVCKQLIPVEESHDDIPSIVQAGSRMATDEFESFVQSRSTLAGIDRVTVNVSLSFVQKRHPTPTGTSWLSITAANSRKLRERISR